MRAPLLALCAALAVSALTLLGVGAFEPKPAEALDPSTLPKFRPPSAEELRAYRIVQDLTKNGSTSQKNVARKIVQRAALRAAPRLAAPIVGAGVLPAAAVGVWAVVGLELYYLPCWGCSVQSIKGASEWRLADGALGGVYTGSNGMKVQGVLTYYGAQRDETGMTSVDVYGVQNVLKFGQVCFSDNTCITEYVGLPSVTKGPTELSGSLFQGASQRAPSGAPPPKVKTHGKINKSFRTTGGLQLDVRTDAGLRTEVLCLQGGTCNAPVRPPALEMGAITEGATAPGSPMKTTPDEGNGIITGVVADPETMPLIETEPSAEPFPDDFPEDPFVDPYESPDGDPDGDGIPNKADEDPEGDGDPDGDGDPNEHPPLAPPASNPDSDDDGVPDTQDPDDDGDGVPDEQDPRPGVWDPPPDNEGDGIPDKTDPDDDNDGIPDTEDPEPMVPTDPSTLPADNPYADPDDDGQPNKDDPDDDNDGTPDEGDTAPQNPDEGGDLDRDGIPDQDDGDQDGDDVPDWEDSGTRERSVPVPPGEPDPDADRDQVPDWSDPWPGNPYAPEQPTRDGDGDSVPDYKDPEISDPSVPMQPWPPGSPGDSPGNPGKPNVPPNPSNLNYPTSPNRPAQPSDPTSTIDPTSPINPTEPMPPGEAGGPPAEQGTSCPIPRKPQVVIPNLRISGVFPFNLVVWAWEALKELHTEPAYPTFELPGFGTLDFGVMSGMFAACRVVITGLLLIALVAGWYTYIRGSEA